MDRLELASQADPTIFTAIALAGVALNGFAWVALGIEIVVRSLRGRGQTVTPDLASVPVAAAGIADPQPEV